LSWSVEGKNIPDLMADSFSLFGLGDLDPEPSYGGDAGQGYALALKRKMQGYRSELPPSTTVIVMALDSATPGRLSIAYYREFGGGEFLDRIETWHSQFAWPQNFGKERRFIGAPSPRDITEAAYGPDVDDRLRRASVERLLPCLIDGQPLPWDFLNQTFRRAVRRIGLPFWDWEKTTGIACGLYRGYCKQRGQGDFAMTLELDRNSRDYLFGRLLAYAERIEERALSIAGESRDTHAAKMMQRFADHPSSTWRQISGQLTPAKSRLRSRIPDDLRQLEQEIDQIFDKFKTNDFISDAKLSAEFLLGFHCQRTKLRSSKADGTPAEAQNSPENEEAP
jgi:CRISPR-associated protein Csd1